MNCWKIGVLGVLILLFAGISTGVLYCLSCHGVISPRHCHTVQRCSYGERCFTEKYTTITGEVEYDIGCTYDCSAKRKSFFMRPRASHEETRQCYQCCSTTVCNSNGCDSPSYPSPRGPLCFSCAETRTPSLCAAVKVCRQHEVCKVQEFSEFGESYYTMSCSSSSFCGGSGISIIGKRSSGTCNKCCSTDLCSANSCSTDPIAFHASLNYDSYIGILKFTNVKTNIGNAYDSATGRFVAPSFGTYVFSWNIETYSQLTEASLEVNGVVRGSSKADEASGYYDTSTSFSILELQQGDIVQIRLTSGHAKATQSIFSGWKLHPTDHSPAFHATLSSSDGGTINFDEIRTNVDHRYDSVRGTFTAPIAGLYVFMTSIIGKSAGDYDFGFNIKGSKSFFGCIKTASNSALYDSNGIMVTAVLNAGDAVYVSSSKALGYSSFSGFLLTNISSYSTYPAFTASLSSDSSHNPVVFNSVHSGYPYNHYSTSTGIFRCTQRGVYIFLVNIESYTQLLTAYIRVNYSIKTHLRSDGRRSTYDCTSIVSVLELNNGDDVSVHLSTGTADEGQTMFNGYLLYPLP